MKHTYIFPSILIALDVLSAIVNSDGCRYRLRHPPEDEMNMVKAARQPCPTVAVTKYSCPYRQFSATRLKCDVLSVD